jgi:hypothetical protein
MLVAAADESEAATGATSATNLLLAKRPTKEDMAMLMLIFAGLVSVVRLGQWAMSGRAGRGLLAAIPLRGGSIRTFYINLNV